MLFYRYMELITTKRYHKHIHTTLQKDSQPLDWKSGIFLTLPIHFFYMNDYNLTIINVVGLSDRKGFALARIFVG